MPPQKNISSEQQFGREGSAHLNSSYTPDNISFFTADVVAYSQLISLAVQPVPEVVALRVQLTVVLHVFIQNVQQIL